MYSEQYALGSFGVISSTRYIQHLLSEEIPIMTEALDSRDSTVVLKEDGWCLLRYVALRASVDDVCN